MKHKSISLEQLNVFSRYYLSMFLVFMALISCTGGDKKTTPPPTQTGGPQFVINSPAENTKIASPVFFSVQPFNASEVASVTFQAGDKELKNDVPYEDDFKVFVDPSDFPTGTLKLTATVKGKNGKQSSKSIDIDVINPADLKETATVRADGAILGTKEANGATSILTIPAGTAQGANVSFEARTKQEVKAATGVDYDALGVTFLGAQEVTSNKPLDSALMVASGGFGPMVQPGQAVVQYAIAPDGDGDGIGELVVVNTASVAPNGDVVSDPIPLVQIDAIKLTNIEGQSIESLQDSLVGIPGTILELEVSGFNPYSLAGNVATFKSSVDGSTYNTTGSITLNPKRGYQQSFSTIIPNLPQGPATLVLTNKSTGYATSPISINVGAPNPLPKPASEIINEFFLTYASLVKTIDASTEDKDGLLKAIEELRVAYSGLNDDKSEATQSYLKEFALIIYNSGVFNTTDKNNIYGGELIAQVFGRCLDPNDNGPFSGRRGFNNFNNIVTFGLGLAALLTKNVNLGAFALTYGAVTQALDRNTPDCKDPPEPEPNSNPDDGSNSTTGMGAASPPGGPGGGNSTGGGPSTSSLNALQFTGNDQYSVKIFTNGKAGPFTGMTDPGGYFYIPFIPADQPFTAVATNVSTGETRTYEGVGPKTGDFVFFNFNFFADATTDLTVTTTANSGLGSLRQVIADAQESDRIGFDVTGTITLSSEIVIDKLLFLDGPGADELTISGGNTTRLFNIKEGAVVSISGLTLANGKADQGGAIYNDGDLNISSSTLKNNEATDSGGALYNAPGTNRRDNEISLINVRVENNKASLHGGGIYNFGIKGLAEFGDINLTIKNSVISNNTAENGSGGGVVIGARSEATISGTDFSKNKAADDGGGLRSGQTLSTITITDSTFSENTAGDRGGAISHSGDIVITRASILDNSAEDRGGGTSGSSNGDLELIESTVANNKSSKSAGGINAREVILMNSTVAFNTAATDAGGIDAKSLTTVNSTVTGNTAGDEAGGVDIFKNGSLSAKNSIITGNTAANSPDIQDGSASFSSEGFNLIGSAEGNGFVNGENNDLVGADPKLGPLADNGGPTQTIALLIDSPAIDAIPAASCKDLDGNDIATDQRNGELPDHRAQVAISVLTK